jgi:Flp pilus assembly protein TadG
MTHSPRIRKSLESGQGTLELALCLPLFLLLILGTAELANIAWASVQLNNAAHAGAQFGSQSRANAADTTDIENAAKNEAPRLITSASTQVTPTQACSCITAAGGTTSNGCETLTECPSPDIIMDNIQVTVHATVTPIIHYPGLPASYTMNAIAIMGVEK